MKKITSFCLVIIALLFFNNNINAQAFEKGTINIDLGIGFGLYGTSQTNTSKATADINGVTTTFHDETRDTTDGAASTVIPLGVEYGISNKIGVGVDFTYSNYLIDPDDKDRIDNVRSYDFGLKGVYHPLNSDFYDLSIGLGFGFSTIKWNFNSVVDTANGNITPASSASGSGFYYGLEIKNKFWFSKHVGAFVNLGYKGYSYSYIEEDNAAAEAQINSLPGFSNTKIENGWKWKLSGANIGLGLALKF